MWRAKVAKKTLNQNAGLFTIDVDFYDEADPQTIIARRAFPLDEHMTLDEIKSKVEFIGRQEQVKHQALSLLDSKISVGDEIAF